MDYVVTLVHGTRLRFTPHATWINGESRFSELLREHVGSPVQVYPFRWTGGNSVHARTDAAHRLSKHLIDTAGKHPSALRFVIGHSHGGNVVVRALGLPETATAVHGAVCLSTPFFAVAKRNFGSWLGGNLIVGALVCVFSLRGLITYLNRTPGSVNGMTVPLTIVSVVIMLLMSLSLNPSVKKWLTRLVTRLRADVELSPSIPIDVFIVRSTADEASALLASVQFVGWLATRATRLASGFAERMQSVFKRAPWIASASLFLVSLFVIQALVSPTSAPWERWTAALVAAVIVLPTALLTIMLVISFILLGVLLTAYGPEIALGAPFLEVSVEPAPSGLSIVCQLPPTNGEGLRHSATYQDEHAIAVVATWLKKTRRRGRAEKR